MIFGASMYIAVPLLGLSVVALALVLERMFFYIDIRWRSRADLKDVLKRIGKESSSVLIGSLEPGDKSPELELLDFALKNPAIRHPAYYRQSLMALRDKLQNSMERHLSILNGIANVATLLGLLGTVSGMIEAFRRMNETGSSDPYVLAGGISQALITTAMGLIVAIPSVLAVYFFESIVERHFGRMDLVMNECLFISGLRYSNEKKIRS